MAKMIVHIFKKKPRDDVINIKKYHARKIKCTEGSNASLTIKKKPKRKR